MNGTKGVWTAALLRRGRVNELTEMDDSAIGGAVRQPNGNSFAQATIRAGMAVAINFRGY